MLFSTLVNSFIVFAATGMAGYVLEDDYFETDFFDHFTFFDGADPTHGFVDYQSSSSASAAGLLSGGSNANDPAKMMVDSANVTPQGRPSVRITSNKSYSSGLVIADIEHMPGSICGTWPAFWMVGPNWPNGGEIDILEGVNNQQSNSVTLHTGPGCSINNAGGFSGTMTHTTCASSYEDNSGCQITSGSSDTYGAGFNNNGGGVYTMEWTSSHISVWFFPRGSIPDDVNGTSPDPSGWGIPLARFAGDCDMSTAFVDQQIVFDTTFCGDWAGREWGNMGCAASATTCEDYVRDNPKVFEEAYWSIKGLRVFQDNGDSAPPPSTYIASSTSVQYVTQPAASTYVVPTSAPTTFVVATSSAAPYVPVVGPSGSVGVGSSPVETGTGYAPVIGGDGTVGAVAEPAETAAVGGGSWSTTPDGAMSYGGWKREEDDVDEVEDVDRRARHARHLRFHKRSGGRI